MLDTFDEELQKADLAWTKQTVYEGKSQEVGEAYGVA